MFWSQQEDRFGAGFGVASQSAASCLSLRMSTAIHPFERLRGLLAIIYIHVISLNCRVILMGAKRETFTAEKSSPAMLERARYKASTRYYTIA